MSAQAVSIVIPTRDRPHLLRLTLRSALAQVGVDLEVLVVDDGETGAAAAVIEAIGDPRLRLVRNTPPHGVSGARNRGIAAARHGWIAFCDDDDLWARDKLVRQLSSAAGAAAEWAYAGEIIVGPNLRVLSGTPPPEPEQMIRELRRRNSMPAGASNVVVRRETLARAGPFDPRLRTSEDWDLWLRIASVAGLPACVCRPLVAYRFHPLNGPLDTKRIIEEPRVLSRRYGIPVDFAAMHRRAAWTLLRSGRRGRAVVQYARAVGRGDVASLARMAYVLTHRRFADETLFRPRRRDAAWVAQAETWLASFRTAPEARPWSGASGVRQ